MELHELPRDREAETNPLILARRRRICLREALEEMRDEAALDADTGVTHFEHTVAVALHGRDRHAAATRREFDRVRQQIPHNLLEASRLAGERRVGLLVGH